MREKEQRERDMAAINIQKNIRGNLARRFVAVKLEAYVHRELQKVSQKRFEWENRVKTKAILKLQRNWRSLVIWRKEEAARQKKINEELTLKAFEAHKKEEIRVRNTYEQGLEKWYRDDSAGASENFEKTAKGTISLSVS